MDDLTLSRQLDEVTALLDIATSPPLRQILWARKAGLERQVFDAYAKPRPRQRCDAETWAAITAGIRKRDGHKCAVCGTNEMRLNVHHLVTVQNGGGDNPQNLLTLCDDCHSIIHPWLGESHAETS